uniref:JmjC domain-containing protein n=2 Tax=Mesocestoides corti TaxID=53468 RepID=A0A5K3FWH3_MESCO
MLTFVEKQMCPQNLRKLCAELLKKGTELTAAELGDLEERSLHSSSAYWPTTIRMSSVFTPPELREEGDSSGSRRKRKTSSAAMSPALKAPRHSSCSSSPPNLLPEVVDCHHNESTARTHSTCERSDFYTGTIDLEAEPVTSPPGERSSSSSSSRTRPVGAGDSPSSHQTLSPASTASSRNSLSRNTNRARRRASPPSPSTQKTSDKPSRHHSTAVKSYPPATPSFTPPIRKSVGRPKALSPTTRVRRVGRKHVSASPSPARPPTTPTPQPERVYAEDAWTFSGSLTDRTPPSQVVAQVKRAAHNARAKLLDTYGKRGQQRIVYLDTSVPGKISAKVCPLAATQNASSAQTLPPEDSSTVESKPVNYPPALRQLLTGRQCEVSSTASASNQSYHGLIEQMTSQQVATLHALSTLRYDPKEPIAMGIHGPLAIFSKDELAQMYDAYGGDSLALEYILSLLSYVEPIGPSARIWAHKKIDAATGGYHGKLVAAFAKTDSEFHSNNWIRRAGLTLDSDLIAEFIPKTDAKDESDVVKDEEPTSQVEVDNLSVGSDLQPLEVEACASGEMSMAKLPSNTSTTTTAVKQMATVQPLQRHESAASQPDDLIAHLAAAPCISEMPPPTSSPPPPPPPSHPPAVEAPQSCVTGEQLAFTDANLSNEILAEIETSTALSASLNLSATKDEEEQASNTSESAADESFDILSAALNASTTPASEDYVINAYSVEGNGSEAGSTTEFHQIPPVAVPNEGLVQDPRGFPTQGAAQPILALNNFCLISPQASNGALAASVSEIAQISALTAAISPIQSVPAPLPACVSVHKSESTSDTETYCTEEQRQEGSSGDNPDTTLPDSKEGSTPESGGDHAPAEVSDEFSAVPGTEQARPPSELGDVSPSTLQAADEEEGSRSATCDSRRCTSPSMEPITTATPLIDSVPPSVLVVDGKDQSSLLESDLDTSVLEKSQNRSADVSVLAQLKSVPISPECPESTSESNFSEIPHPTGLTRPPTDSEISTVEPSSVVSCEDQSPEGNTSSDTALTKVHSTLDVTSGDESAPFKIPLLEPSKDGLSQSSKANTPDLLAPVTTHACHSGPVDVFPDAVVAQVARIPGTEVCDAQHTPSTNDTTRHQPGVVCDTSPNRGDACSEVPADTIDEPDSTNNELTMAETTQ